MDVRLVIEALEKQVAAARASRSATFSTARTVAERSLLPTDPPPGAMRALDEMEPESRSPTSTSTSVSTSPSPSPPPSVSTSTSPVEVRSRPTVPWGRVAVGCAVGGAVALAAIVISQPSAPTRAPVPPADTALAAAFDAVEAEAEEDVGDEEAAETAAAIRSGAPPSAPPEEHVAPDDVPPLAHTVLDGPTIDGMIQRGNFARHRGDFDLAVRYFDDVIASDPQNGRALAGLTRTYQERGDLAEAARVARLMLDAHPDHPANFVLLADLLSARGDHDGARAVLEDVTYRFPRYEPAHERLDALGRSAP